MRVWARGGRNFRGGGKREQVRSGDGLKYVEDFKAGEEDVADLYWDWNA